MTDPFVYYGSTGLVASPGLYLQLDDADNTIIPFVEGAGAKKRRYAISLEDFREEEIPAGRYYPTVRLGDPDAPTDTDPILTTFDFTWDGENENTGTEGSSGGGGNVLRARLSNSSLTQDDYLEIIQGERKSLLIIVDPIGRFNYATFPDDSITVKFGDSQHNVVVKNEWDEGNPITRVCQQLDLQVIRVVLNTEDTMELQGGQIEVEIAFDTQKVRLSHSMRIIETLSEEGS